MAKRTFEELVELMKKLRAPGGCPWDREQTLEDLKPFIIEEAYEVVDAIDKGDRTSLREEIGDLLLEAVFAAQIAEEEGSFDISDSITGVHDKLVRRHPHVFGDVIAESAGEVVVNWEKLKNAERQKANQSLLDGLPEALPALLKASRLTEKAARVGFDWNRTEDVFDKVDEELKELRDAVRSGDRKEIAHEIGDLFFTVANLARKLEVSSEESLQATNRRFSARFRWMEDRLREQGRAIDDASLEELDALWNGAKASGL